MLQGEHSAIISTFIKVPFVINNLVLSIFEWPLKTGFTSSNVKTSALSSRNRVDSKCERIYIFGRKDVESLPDISRGTLVPDHSGRLLKRKAPYSISEQYFIS